MSTAFPADSPYPSFPNTFKFKCAVTDSKGPRRFMEDAHSIVVPYAGVRGQGFFAIFDGHAGKQAAEWCGQNFSMRFLQALRRNHNGHSIPDTLNEAFHDVDTTLSRMTEESEGKMHSGCTAVTAFLRLEDHEGKQSFLPPDFDPFKSSMEMIEADVNGSSDESGGESPDRKRQKKSSTSKIKDAFKSLGGGTTGNATANSNSSSGKVPSSSMPGSISESSSRNSMMSVDKREKERIFTPNHSLSSNIRRVLYCANAGDARGVLCRGGKAVRLTYDHKGSDKQEAKRIMDAGGFVMSGRVNGVLAVTRSLGDSSMKEFVVGAPYTTETELCEDDEFLILACDGLWDVIEDQAAVELVRGIADPKRAAELLLDTAYKNYSTDNVTVLVVRFRNPPENIEKKQ